MGHLEKGDNFINEKTKKIHQVNKVRYENSTWPSVTAASVFQLHTSKNHSERGNVNWENNSMRLAWQQACGIFSSLMVGVVGPSPLWIVPPWMGDSGWFKKGG